MKKQATTKTKTKARKVVAKPTKKKAQVRPVKQTKQTPKKPVTGRKPDASWHDRFIEILGASCNVTLAAEGAGVCRATAYQHRDLFPEFAKRWSDAEERAVDLLEEEAWKRAKTQSDTLMIFLLKGRRRHLYGESIEHRVKKLTDEELIAQAAGTFGGDDSEGADPS